MNDTTRRFFTLNGRSMLWVLVGVLLMQVVPVIYSYSKHILLWTQDSWSTTFKFGFRFDTWDASQYLVLFISLIITFTPILFISIAYWVLLTNENYLFDIQASLFVYLLVPCALTIISLLGRVVFLVLDIPLGHWLSNGEQLANALVPLSVHITAICAIIGAIYAFLAYRVSAKKAAA